MSGPTLTPEDWWAIYDLVTARTEAIDAAELAAMQGLGGDQWRALRRKVRAYVATPEAGEVGEG